LRVSSGAKALDSIGIFGMTRQLAEKSIPVQKHPSAAKAGGHNVGLTYGLKPIPFKTEGKLEFFSNL
jgi:hypothetical protein